MERMDLFVKDKKVRLVKVDSNWFVVASDIGGLLTYKRKNHCITHIKDANKTTGKVKSGNARREVALSNEEGIIDILESCTLKNIQEERIKALEIKEFLEILNSINKTDYLKMTRDKKEREEKIKDLTKEVIDLNLENKRLEKEKCIICRLKKGLK